MGTTGERGWAQGEERVRKAANSHVHDHLAHTQGGEG